MTLRVLINELRTSFYMLDSERLPIQISQINTDFKNLLSTLNLLTTEPLNKNAQRFIANIDENLNNEVNIRNTLVSNQTLHMVVGLALTSVLITAGVHWMTAGIGASVIRNTLETIGPATFDTINSNDIRLRDIYDKFFLLFNFKLKVP